MSTPQRKALLINGKRIWRERRKDGEGVCAEYFGKPIGASVFHKLGQYFQKPGGAIEALRGMSTGTEIQDFNTLEVAELWISQCDTWGELENTEHTVNNTPSV